MSPAELRVRQALSGEAELEVHGGHVEMERLVVGWIEASGRKDKKLESD